MPILISSLEMAELARKLAKMRFNRARAHVRRMDRHVNLDYFRIAVGPEYRTRYSLPGKNLLITLVEQREDLGRPDSLGNHRVRYKYVEARVEPLPADHPVLDHEETLVSGEVL